MKVNALQVRQSFGKILKKLQIKQEPIIIEKGREPVAVLISMKSFKERFIDYQELKKREQILNQFRKAATRPAKDSLKVLRSLRYDADS